MKEGSQLKEVSVGGSSPTSNLEFFVVKQFRGGEEEEGILASVDQQFSDHYPDEPSRSSEEGEGEVGSLAPVAWVEFDECGARVVEWVRSQLAIGGLVTTLCRWPSF